MEKRMLLLLTEWFMCLATDSFIPGLIADVRVEGTSAIV